MNDTGMTTMEVKKINRKKVYQFLYNEGTSCKLMITQKLQMGLSTVTQNLKILEEEGLIQKNGFFNSTGGRKADAVEIIKTARISIGIAVLKEMVDFVAIDLYGDLIVGKTFSLNFHTDDDYYQTLGQLLTTFLEYNHLDSSKILGVSIATQGNISNDGTYVSYGEILGNTSMNLSSFQKYIPFPCRLEHDSKAAAKLELWKNKGIQDAILLLLNRNMGGAIITNGAVQNGLHMRSGTIEHLSININGPLCYCGKKGCLETYCSVNSLEETSNMNLSNFFAYLRTGNLKCQQIWNEYLNCLALAIGNLSVVIDGNFIISGYLAPFFEDKDIDFLLEKVNMSTTFPLERSSIILGSNGQFTQAIGASLSYVEEFLGQV